MDKDEVLQKTKRKKVFVGEMEKQKIDKASWIGNICACAVAIIFMIVEGILGHHSSIFAIATICFTWASVFYFCQFFIAKRPYGVLIGAVLEGIGACIMITNYILYNLGII